MACHVQQLLRVHLRWMRQEDLPAMVRMEAETVEHRWTGPQFMETLSRRQCLGMVVEHAQQIIGYLIYEIQNDTVILLNLYVSPCFRRRGVASQMLARVCCQLGTSGGRFIRATVRETELSSQLFLQSLGFRANMILKDHFEDTGEDGYHMQYRHKPVRIRPASRCTVLTSRG